MRDLYKLVLLVPVVIILSVFLLRLQGGSGEIEFYANGTDVGPSSGIRLEQGSGIGITATRGSHDVAYEISSTSPGALKYMAHQSPSNPAKPTLTLQGDATMDVALNYPFGGDTMRPVYTLGVDVPSLAAAVGQPAALDVWDPHYSPNPPATDQYRPLRELRIRADQPLTVRTAYDDAEDEMVYDVSLEGGIDGQLVTSTGPSSDPAYEDLNLSVEGRTATQLDVASSSPGTNATLNAVTSTLAGLMTGLDKVKLDQLYVERQLPDKASASAGDGLVLEDIAGVLTPAWAAAPAGGLQSATVTLSAGDVAALDTTRIQVVPAPATGQYLMPVRMVIIKTGGPDTASLPSSTDPDATKLAWQNTHIALAFDSAAGGLMGDPGPECTYDAWLANGSVFASGWLADTDDYISAFNLIPSSSGGFGGLPTGSSCSSSSSIKTGYPLVIVGSARDDDNGTNSDTSDDRTAAEVWDDYTAASILDDLSLKIIVYYDTVTP